MDLSQGSWRGPIYALVAAFLFGVSVPIAKLLIGSVDPLLLAGLLYLGSGIGLGITWIVRRRSTAREASLTRKDMPWLLGACLAGGVVGPALLMFGLTTVNGASASLLLNFEGVFTALLAWFVFKENFDSRILFGMILITCGGILLSWNGQSLTGLNWGLLAVISACFAWGIDNNLTRKISTSSPIQITAIKGIVAGGVNTLLALMLGAKLPSMPILLGAGLLGLFGYGISLILFVLALRYVGSARTGAYFSSAPFFGACLALMIWPESFSPYFFIAAILMGVGIWLHLTERHEHFHIHEPLIHAHSHFHDSHHQHEHGPNDPNGEPHTHEHKHTRLEHSHPHYPDIHHRHSH
jgi:drug/metabolite transporter (DMT)-like permease